MFVVWKLTILLIVSLQGLIKYVRQDWSEAVQPTGVSVPFQACLIFIGLILDAHMFFP